MTLADNWVQNAPKDWADISAYLADVHKFDPEAYFKMVNSEPAVIFSDGSIHPMRKGTIQ